MFRTSLTIWLAAFVMFIFISKVEAQRCGGYCTILIVTNSAEKAVSLDEIKLKSYGKDELIGNLYPSSGFTLNMENAKEWAICFGVNQIIENNYLLTISAKGFVTYRKRLTFPRCINQRFEIKLVAQSKKKGKK